MSHNIYFLITLMLSCQVSASDQSPSNHVLNKTNNPNDSIIRNEIQIIGAGEFESLSALSFSNDSALFGSNYNNNKGTDAGAVYAFELQNESWVMTQTLTADDAMDDARFGSSVSVDSNRALIGARFDGEYETRAGAVYEFKKLNGNWEQQTKIVASDLQAQDWFGSEVLLSGDQAFISAGVNLGATRGAVYVFNYENGGWVEGQRLVPQDFFINDDFGSALSLDGEFLVIASSRDDSSRGAVYVYRQVNGVWFEYQKLTPNIRIHQSRFGASVSIHHDQILIGAAWEPQNEILTGAVYIFKLQGNNWVETGKILPDEMNEHGYFGTQVVNLGNRAIISSSELRNQADTLSVGAVFEYKLVDENWIRVKTLSVEDLDSPFFLGRQVSFENNRLLAITRSYNDFLDNSAYSFSWDLFFANGFE